MDKIDDILSELSFSQKLDLMETIWDDLIKHEKELKSPVWHYEVLKDRDQAVADGKAHFSAWNKAKERIKRNIS